jgi:hypothetical protein
MLLTPPEIFDKVIELYIEGKSNEEIRDSLGLPENKVDEIILDFGLPEVNFQSLAHYLAVKLGKDGTDVKDLLYLKEAKKLLVDQGLRPYNFFQFVSQVFDLCKRIGIGPTELVNAFDDYQKLPQACRRSFDEMELCKKRAFNGMIYLSEIEDGLHKEQQELKANLKLAKAG